MLPRQLDDLARQHAEERSRNADRHAANERHHLQEIDRARADTKKVEKELQDTQETSRKLTEKAQADRERSLVREQALSGAIASRDRQLAEREQQLLEVKAALSLAQQTGAAYQQLASANEARINELKQALAASRRSEEDLRREVHRLQQTAARAGANGPTPSRRGKKEAQE
jgi:chromosome segregation ATPase